VADTLDGDLRRFLLEEMYRHPPAARRGAHWVMNGEWALECRKLAGAPLALLPSMTPDGPEVLFGFPIEVRGDGGTPHLEIPGA
jgi:hypothetical protein